MPKIPRARKQKNKRITPTNISPNLNDEKVLFSFEKLDRNEYFNLDGTCINWPSDLFDTMKKVSSIPVKEIYAGCYSGKTSPFRIHRHETARVPCALPQDISLEELWQIRISLSKGGVHGVFIDNVFYVLWFDPQHNMYPDKNHGGLVRIKPPSTCCKERDRLIEELQEKLYEVKSDLT